MGETNLKQLLLRLLHQTGFGKLRGRGYGTTVKGQVAILLLNVFTGVASARILGPQGRGQLQALILWPSVLLLLATMGINQAIVFHVGKRQFEISEVWTGTLVIGLVQSAFVILAGAMLLPVALRSYPGFVRHYSFIYLMFTPIIMVGGYPANFLQGKLDMGSFNLVRCMPGFVYAVGLAALASLRSGSLGEVVAVQLLGAVVGAGLAYALLLKGEKLRLAWNPRAALSVSKFGFKTQFESVNSYVNQRVDQLLLSLFVPPRELGLYVVAVTLATAVAFFPQAMGIVTLASGSNLPPSEARQAISVSFRLSLVWLLLLCTGIFIVAPQLIGFFFGSEFAGSVLACRILLPGTAFLGLRQVLYEGARALGKPAVPSYAEGFGTLVTVSALYLLLPRYGFVGAAIASSFAYGASLVFILMFCQFRLGISLRELFGASRLPLLERSV
jgi:O-antigen/teichoic acid export membrane protein